tara:strand:+ start:195 stop:374 length:180 start_codon:yes stop_codon:yes gene_type:complete
MSGFGITAIIIGGGMLLLGGGGKESIGMWKSLLGLGVAWVLTGIIGGILHRRSSWREDR